uniref:NADH-ubiquinone oxidoreductase chain 6 n=1 Tax=Cavernulicola chilensis TaxID=3028028 RepID=A0A7H0WB81_9RHOD|nr:NADH dehydrogenase subunit 6 [Cavernulicola chilensis]QNR39810.1 NADH dehydrogenase subunit 6 [Cavernulicola chilensis]
MATELLLFYCFGSLAFVSGCMVPGSKNPVHSVLFLILVFCNVSGLLLLIGAEFLAIIFLVVYVGAIAVLFLFVVIILNMRISELEGSLFNYAPIGGMLAIILLGELFLSLNSDLLPAKEVFRTPEWALWASEITNITNIEALGSVLYTSYAYLFLMGGLILLVAIIGAIVLTIHQRGEVRRQDISLQVARDFNSAVQFAEYKSKD